MLKKTSICAASYILCIFFLVLHSGAAHAYERVALVIGNGDYASAPLRNPTNDAADIASVLETLGFKVIKKTNVNQRQMLDSIAEFSSELKKAEVGLFYFAGHGMQINGTNYLIPIGVKVLEEDDIEFEAVQADRIISKMRLAGNKLNMVILDSCRNNPFKRSFRSSMQGLARMDAPKGTVIAYATSPGEVAADGNGRNGIFTKHLLSTMNKPNLGVQEIFNEAGLQVMAETNDQQIPWTTNTPIPKYYLAGIGKSELPQVIPSKASSEEPSQPTLPILSSQRPETEKISLTLVECNIGSKYNKEIVQMSPGACVASGGTKMFSNEAKSMVSQLPQATKRADWFENQNLNSLKARDKQVKCRISTSITSDTVSMSSGACVASGGVIVSDK